MPGSIHLSREERTGVEALSAHFVGHAYDMHHHDEWLVGVTDKGVQDFFCRGARLQSTPGRVILIGPGESHDGRAVTPAGFAYRMLYLPHAWMRAHPSWPSTVLGFRETIVDDARLAAATRRAHKAITVGAQDLAVDEALDSVIEQLRFHAGSRPQRRCPPAPSIAARARDYLNTYPTTAVTLDALAQMAGASDRFQLARAFRREYGTSPHGFLVQLRLARARELLRADVPPADVASASGFADQSHMGRWFRRAFAITPAAYRRGRTDVPDRTVRYR